MSSSIFAITGMPFNSSRVPLFTLAGSYVL